MTFFPTKRSSRTSSLLVASLLAVACSSRGGSDVLMGESSGGNAGNAAPQDPNAVGPNRGIPSNSAARADAGARPEAGSPVLVPGDIVENDFVDTTIEATSTFSVDVDTSSYTRARQSLVVGALPESTGVRSEEFLNYFDYGYADPTPEEGPLAVSLEAAPSKFGDGLSLVRVALQAKRIPESQRNDLNLVFLVDVSGSMSSEDKLPLVKYALTRLVDRLRPTDTLGIVVYAGRESTLLASTPVSDKAKIQRAIEGLSSGGSTNGEGGIRAAYNVAESAKANAPNSESRVVLCTDGDFNVGLTGDALTALVEQERERGITLTTLGFGASYYGDQTLENLADKGNGNSAFIDTREEADRVLGTKIVSTLQTLAKDTKIQVTFDADVVRRYRLVGYDNRVLANEDFTDDRKDAGDVGAGHSVTAFYEVELATGTTPLATDVDGAVAPATLATVKLRYKEPGGTESVERAYALPRSRIAASFEQASGDFRFAASVVEFAEILRKSRHSTGARFSEVRAIAAPLVAQDPARTQFVDLVAKASSIWR
ncbi:MAG: von Willebrand factor type A domain-containing protein [Polyangiaceae bacterium]